LNKGVTSSIVYTEPHSWESWQFFYSSEKNKGQQCMKLHGCLISDTIYNRKKQTTLSLITPHNCYLFWWTDLIFSCMYKCTIFMHDKLRNVSVRPHQVNHYVRIFDASFRNNLYGFVRLCESSPNFFYPITSNAWCFLRSFIFLQLFNASV